MRPSSRTSCWREPDVVGADDIRDYLSDKLARYKIPRDYVFATVLPRTPTGKIQKHLHPLCALTHERALP